MEETTMAVIRISKTKGFTVMSNYHLRDKNLTLKAKGLDIFPIAGEIVRHPDCTHLFQQCVLRRIDSIIHLRLRSSLIDRWMFSPIRI